MAFGRLLRNSRCRVEGTSVDILIVDALKSDIERARDKDFTSRAKQRLERDKELSERLPN